MSCASTFGRLRSPTQKIMGSYYSGFLFVSIEFWANHLNSLPVEEAGGGA